MTTQPLPSAPPGRATRTGVTAPGRPLAAFHHRDFRFLLGSTMALQIGSWVQTIGMGWLVLNDLGGGATDLAIVALVRGASLLLISPVGGYLAGRSERRRQLVIYTSISAALAGLLAVLIVTGSISLWVIYLTATIGGIVEALAGPIRVLLVYDSVGGEDLTNAVALNSLGGSAMRVIGPSIGGALISTVGTQGAFQMQAAALILCVVLTWQLRPSKPEPNKGEGMFRSIAAGGAYVWRDRRMLVIVGMAILPSILVFPYVTFLPVFAKNVLHGDESTYGFLAAAVGLGSLAGGGLVAFTAGRSKMGAIMIWTCIMYAVFVTGFALSSHVWLSIVMLTLAGVFFSVYQAFNASLMQLKADPEFRSRVMSLQTMTWGTTPFAALIMGRMIDAWGAPYVVASWTSLAAVVALAVAIGSREMRRI